MDSDHEDEFEFFSPLFQPQNGPELPDSNASEEEIFSTLVEILGRSLAGMFQQSVHECDQAVIAVDALSNVAEGILDEESFCVLSILQHQIYVSSSMVWAVKLSTEGRYTKVKECCHVGQSQCERGIELCEQLRAMQLDGMLPDEFQGIPFVFSVYSRILTASTLGADADVHGFRGRTDEYLQGLAMVAEEYRMAADELSGCAQPELMILRQICAQNCERLQTRVEYFELSANDTQLYQRPTGKKIFIVHGHDEAKWRELRQLLEHEWGLETVILWEEANSSRTVIQKFEDYANECCYAFVLLTPDDLVDDGDTGYSQARPNVLFELGWFYGRFGPSRICILNRKGTNVPSDLRGVVTYEFDTKVVELYTEIRDELRESNLLPSD